MKSEHNQPLNVKQQSGSGVTSKLIILGAVIFGTLAYGLGVWPRIQQSRALKADAQLAGSQSPKVEYVNPHSAFDGELVLPANIQAVSDTPVFSRAAGYIVGLYADIGSRVNEGQILAKIEAPDVQHQYQQSQADTGRAESTVTQATSDLDRLRANVAQAKAAEARATAESLQVRSQITSAEARLAQAKSNKAVAEAKLAESLQALEGQKSALKQSDAQLELADATSKRIRGLLRDGFIAQQDDDQAQATLKTLTAGNATGKALVAAAMANVRSARETVNAAQSAIDAATSDVRTSQEGFNASQASVQAAQANTSAQEAAVRSGKVFVDVNRAGVRSQLANQRRFGSLASYQELKAPFSGVITARNVDVGTLVAAGGGTGNTGPTATGAKIGLFGLARTEEMRIQVSVPQTYLDTVKLGSKAIVTVAELPNQKFEGTVTQQSGALDPANRTRTSEIRLKNPKGLLVPGMFAQIAFPNAGKVPTIRVPANALMIGARGTQVVVLLPNNTVHFTQVRLGKDFGQEAEILAGVKGDENLVTNPSNDLVEGMRVEATKAAPLPGSPGAGPPAAGQTKPGGAPKRSGE